MNLKLLEKMRGSCPSRASLMDFIHHKDDSLAIVKLDAHQVDEMSSPISDAKLMKEPLSDITNVHSARDNSEQYETIKKTSEIAHGDSIELELIKASQEEQPNGDALPTTNKDVSHITQKPLSSHKRCEAAENNSDDEASSVVSERAGLNPEAPVFTQQQKTTEQQPIGSPSFEVSSEDLSYFIQERVESDNGESASDDSLTHPEVAEPQIIHHSTQEAATTENSLVCNEITNTLARDYSYSHYATTQTPFIKTFTSEHEAADDQFVESLHYEAADYHPSPPYYEYLDTIFEESEPECGDVIEPKFTEPITSHNGTASTYETSTTGSESAANESEVIDSLITDSLVTDATIIDPDAPKTVASEYGAQGPKRRTIRFDRNGDLYLKVGKYQVRNMLVDSRALGRASTKLHAVISQSAKDQSDDRWTIKFPNDDPKSFCILLNLIHARFEKVPAQVTLDQLYGVCTLANKYDMTNVLRTVAERWYVSARTLEKTSIFKMAFIAWELGFQTDFGEIIGYITHNCSLDADSQLVFGPNNQRLADNKILQKLPVMSKSYTISLLRHC